MSNSIYNLKKKQKILLLIKKDIKYLDINITRHSYITWKKNPQNLGKWNDIPVQENTLTEIPFYMNLEIQVVPVRTAASFLKK